MSSKSPEPQNKTNRSWTIATAIYLFVTFLFFATTSAQRLDTHTPYNHFALLADAWLHGRLDLGGPPPAYTGNNDFAVWEGKHFVSFPPFPALLILPLVKLVGQVDRVRDGAFFGCFTGLAPALLYLCLDKLTRTGRSSRDERENILLALLFACGSVYWFSAVQGTVWFVGHVIGAALAAAYLFASTNATHPIVAGLALSLGFATRTPLGFAFPLFLWEAVRASRVSPTKPCALDNLDMRALTKRCVLFAVPAAAVLSVLMWHNHARFGDPFEFGHRLLAIGWRARIDKWGLFSYHYLGKNLAVVLTALPFTGGTNAALGVVTMTKPIPSLQRYMTTSPHAIGGGSVISPQGRFSLMSPTVFPSESRRNAIHSSWSGSFATSTGSERNTTPRRPCSSTGSSRTVNPLASITTRFGPYSPGRQAMVLSPSQLLSSRLSAFAEPVVNTTSAAAIPVSVATAARPASSTGSAASAAT